MKRTVHTDKVSLPLIVTTFDQEELPKKFAVTSSEAPHRAADALFRDSLFVGLIFRKSSKCRILDTVDVRKAAGLFGLCPTALIFGLWDSTGPRGGLGAKFQRAFEDRSGEGRDPDHRLGRRQLARKPAILQEIKQAKGKRAPDMLAKALTKAALELIEEQLRAIVVFANRIAAARKIYRMLQDREDIEAVLLTGRMRPIDKDDVVDRQLTLLRSEVSEKRALPKPRIVVATQTLAVGADLDFDGLVTECASLDALRRRFGRLNRMGRPIEARAGYPARKRRPARPDPAPDYRPPRPLPSVRPSSLRRSKRDRGFRVVRPPDELVRRRRSGTSRLRRRGPLLAVGAALRLVEAGLAGSAVAARRLAAQ